MVAAILPGILLGRGAGFIQFGAGDNLIVDSSDNFFDRLPFSSRGLLRGLGRRSRILLLLLRLFVLLHLLFGLRRFHCRFFKDRWILWGRTLSRGFLDRRVLGRRRLRWILGGRILAQHWPSH